MRSEEAIKNKKEYIKRWRAANPDKVKQWGKTFRAAHPERRKEYDKAYALRKKESAKTDSAKT